MIKQENILMTGGNGLLGNEIKKLIPNSFFPEHKEFDVTDYIQMDNYLNGKGIEAILHAAAFISPPVIDKNPLKAIETNIIGTSNIVKLASKYNSKLIYISTDYVFKGDKGNYSEEDEVYPVNKYAWSKLGGECAVRLYDNSLIIRTTFSQNEFPHEKAFVDQWTSRESVSEIAKKIVNILEKGKEIRGIIHLGGKRRTVMEYAKSLSPSKKIGELYLNEVSFKSPKDTSLNCEKYNQIFGGEK
jgi:dTDP-4-dehydrorhamnose reductase